MSERRTRHLAFTLTRTVTLNPTPMHLPAIPIHRPLTFALGALLACSTSFPGYAQEKPASPLKDEMRTPWTRSHERFIRQWQVLGAIPLAAPGAFAQDLFAGKGGEATLRPDEKAAVEVPNGPALHWRTEKAWRHRQPHRRQRSQARSCVLRLHHHRPQRGRQGAALPRQQ
jgi:hypothetical protein